MTFPVADHRRAAPLCSRSAARRSGPSADAAGRSAALRRAARRAAHLHQARRLHRHAHGRQQDPAQRVPARRRPASRRPTCSSGAPACSRTTAGRPRPPATSSAWSAISILTPGRAQRRRPGQPAARSPDGRQGRTSSTRRSARSWTTCCWPRRRSCARRGGGRSSGTASRAGRSPRSATPCAWRRSLEQVRGAGHRADGRLLLPRPGATGAGLALGKAVLGLAVAGAADLPDPLAVGHARRPGRRRQPDAPRCSACRTA